MRFRHAPLHETKHTSRPLCSDPALTEVYTLVRSEAVLEGRLLRLRHQLSDANLAAMPEFQATSL